MIDMKKMIVRLLGSCLLCSALTLNCRGLISSRFYDCLTTYTEENAGYSPNAYYSDSDCHGYIDGRWEEARTVSTPYSQIPDPQWHYSQWKAFEVMNTPDGDYVQNGDYACPLWCSTNDKPVEIWNKNEYGGNDLTYEKWHDSIYIRGLECIGTYAAGSSSWLPSIEIRSTPVAIDECAFGMVQGLQKLNFSAFPYYVAPHAFPDSVNEIEFHDSEVSHLIGCFTDSEFDKTLKNLALKNRPENECSLNKKKTSLYDRVLTWTGFEENEPYTLFNFFKNHREYSYTKDPLGRDFISADSHLYLINKDDPKNAYLLWTRYYKRENLVDLYWGDYYKLWGEIDKTPSNALAVDSSTISSSPSSSGKAIDGSDNISSEFESTLEGSQSVSSNASGNSDTLSSDVETKSSSISTNAADESTQAVSSDNQTSNKTGSSSASASTKTGYSSDINSLLPMILSGGSVLVLKKKKDN